METYVTASIFIFGICVIGFGRWLELRPRRGLDVPLIPPVAISVAGMVLILLAGAHLVSIFGLKHGR